MAIFHLENESEESLIIDLKAQRRGGWLKELMFLLVAYVFERKLNVSMEARCSEKIIGDEEARSMLSGLELKRAYMSLIWEVLAPSELHLR